MVWIAISSATTLSVLFVCGLVLALAGAILLAGGRDDGYPEP